MSITWAAVHFGVPSHTTVATWERTYWEEGPEALCKDNRGMHKVSKDKTKKPKMPKIDKQTEDDLIAEVQRLRVENEYLKRLNALVQAWQSG